jgi:hypothetical protein
LRHISAHAELLRVPVLALASVRAIKTVYTLGEGRKRSRLR